MSDATSISETPADPLVARRRLNWSALTTSIVGLVVLTGAAYGWYRYSLGRNAKTLFDYAQQCADKKDYATAAAQFDRYLRFRSRRCSCQELRRQHRRCSQFRSTVCRNCRG